jgi:hypothetical protein
MSIINNFSIETQKLIVNGGLFSVFFGLHELYHVQKNKNVFEIWFRIGAHMTIGFIYGASFTYYWKLPALITMYKMGEGFYCGK